MCQSHTTLRDISDEALGRLVRAQELAGVPEADRCPDLDREIMRRFEKLAGRTAATHCGMLAHRGKRCDGPGACDAALVPVQEEVLRLLLGRLVDGKRRPKKSMLAQWAADRRNPDASLGDYLDGAFHNDDALRAWCGFRGLPSRGDRPPVSMVEELVQIYRLATIHNPGELDLEQLDPAVPRLIERWLDAMFRDAVQAGTHDLFDADRIARRLLGRDPSRAEVREVCHRTAILDEVISIKWPKYYQNYFDRGRQQTNVGGELAD